MFFMFVLQFHDLETFLFYKSNQLLIFSILVIFGLNAFEGEYEKNNSQWKIFVTTLMLESAAQPELFCKNSVFKNFPKFTGKRLYQNFFLIKTQVSGLQLYKEEKFCQIFKNTIRRISANGCFPNPRKLLTLKP